MDAFDLVLNIILACNEELRGHQKRKIQNDNNNNGKKIFPERINTIQQKTKRKKIIASFRLIVNSHFCKYLPSKYLSSTNDVWMCVCLYVGVLFNNKKKTGKVG